MGHGKVIFNTNLEELTSVLGAGHYSKIGVLADSNTVRKCYPLVRDVLASHELLVVPAGEKHKNLDTCRDIWQQLTDYQFDRHSLLIIVGGGVIGDMGGFCAATYKRGIDFMLVPTTLLAQVDASVGGKLGIDFDHYKNHIGVFCEPAATVINTGFLRTLPVRELRSGFAEVIKHCLIGDASRWQDISTCDLEGQDWEALVHHSVEFKKSVTAQDPKEKGLRKILNFGHTVGHAAETFALTGAHPLFHGEAVALGMIIEAHVALQKNMITRAAFEAIAGYVFQIFGKANLDANDETLMALMAQDKKNRGDEIRMALPEGIGQAKWDIAVSATELKNAFQFYRTYQT